jgi:hypothetical protein
MKLTKDLYIKENIKLSLKNTNIVLSSINNNLTTIKDIAKQIQLSKNKQDSIGGLMRIRELSVESIVEKCNMLKASIDRYTIPYEDVKVPKEIKYIKLHGTPGPSIADPAQNPRFRDKISKHNVPSVLTPTLVDDDISDDYD